MMCEIYRSYERDNRIKKRNKTGGRKNEEDGGRKDLYRIF
jgi:hypothetical protein